MIAPARRVGVLGRDAHTDDLFALIRPDSVYPRGHSAVAAWWPGFAFRFDDHAAVNDTAAAVALADPDAVLAADVDLFWLAGEAALDADLVARVAASGTEAVAFLPVAAPDGGPGRLRTTSTLRASLAGTHALASLARGDVGRPLALYHGVRAPGANHAPGRTLRCALWEALDMVLEVMAVDPVRIFYRASTLLANHRDHLHLLLRFPDDAIATLDLLELPPAATDPDIDLEVTGTNGLLRLRPYAHQVTVSALGGRPVVEHIGWHPEPARLLLDHLVAERSDTSTVAPAWSMRLWSLAQAIEARLDAGTEGVFEP